MSQRTVFLRRSLSIADPIQSKKDKSNYSAVYIYFKIGMKNA